MNDQLDSLLYPRSKTPPRVVVLILWVTYLLVFGLFQTKVGLVLASMAVLPVIAASWYFGSAGGLSVAVLTILINSILLWVGDDLPLAKMIAPANWIGDLALLVIGSVFGALGTVAREHRAFLVQLQDLEKERRVQANFMAVLNEITLAVLEASGLESILEILVTRTAELFHADQCLLVLWDEANPSPVLKVLSGSASNVDPPIHLEPCEINVAARMLATGHTLVISDSERSPYDEMMGPKMAEIFRNKSLLGLPLASREQRMGVVFLVYPPAHTFPQGEIERGELAARQMALALGRVQLFEDSQRRVKELEVLHEIALASTQVEGEDQLIEVATEIIGRSLFPDNFGILLLDAAAGVLYPHSSYRVRSAHFDPPGEIVALGQGVTGQVAQTGKAQRIGDVSQLENYIAVDSDTCSELCVPLKIRERVLGVINAESTKRNGFTENDEKLMVILAGQLATALEYLRSLKAERNWLSQLAHSNELVSALSHVTAEIEKAFSRSDVIRVLGEQLQKMGLICLPALYSQESDQMIFQTAALLPVELWGHEVGIREVGYKLPAEKIEALFEIESMLAPAVLPAPLKAIKTLLGGLPVEVIAKTLRDRDIMLETEIIHLPLLFEGRLLGLLWLWGNSLTKADLPVLSIFAKQMAIALENARVFEEVQNLALTDPLTGLYNRRGLFELGRVEFARSLRTGRPFSAIMVDLDHFKRVNDKYGHYVGDKVLQEFAGRCKRSVREVDFVGRYGGEEVIILLPETDLQASVEVAERLRKAISGLPVQIAKDFVLDVTASLGVAQRDENTATVEILIARADQAMYIAKHKGRDRVAKSS
jgi:diguanylate cyclase (GGDEF)-like protein